MAVALLWESVAVSGESVSTKTQFGGVAGCQASVSEMPIN